MYTAAGKSPRLNFQSLTEGLHVPRRKGTAEPSYTKAGALDGFHCRTDLQPHAAIPSRRAAATGRGAYSWMGQKAGWSVGPMKLHAKTTKLPRLGQFWMFTFQLRQADTDVQEGANRPPVSICFTADACTCLILSTATCTTQNGGPWYLLAWAETGSLLLPGTCAAPDGYTRQSDYMV